MSNQLDFLAIGDITTDAFIRIKEAEVHCDIRTDQCQICLNFADKIPYESVTVIPAVGNSPNAAVAASRLGLTSALIANIGDDREGKDCLDALTKERVRTDYVRAHPQLKTNYHYVLWYKDERTILVKHEEYTYELPKELETPKWIYLSSLGGSSESFHHAIYDYLVSHPEVKLAFQPGTFQMRLGYEKLSALYARTDILICNTQEAKLILKTSEREPTVLLHRFKSIGPKIVCITDGPKGAYTIGGLEQGNNEAWFMPPFPDPKPPYERTGAGDAFASTFTSALILGKPVEEALRWAPINSAYVVQEIGAQKGLLTREVLEGHLASAPADYKPHQI